MSNKYKVTHLTSLKPQSRDNIYKTSATQLQTIFEYLSTRIATGIPQKSICRYKRDLEKSELLIEVEKNFVRLQNLERDT